MPAPTWRGPASLSLRAAFDASLWVGITPRSAHGRIRRLNGSPWVAVIRPAALAPTRNPGPREAFGGFASGPDSAGAHDSACPRRRRPGLAHVECKIYICTYEAASRRRPHKSSCPCRGARRLPRDSSRGFGCAVFAYAFRQTEGLESLIPQGLRFAAIANLFWARRAVRRAPFVAIPSMGLLRRLRGHHAALVIGLASRGNSMLAPTPFRCL